MPPYLRPADAVVYSGMSWKTIRRLCDDGLLRVYTTPGGHRRVDRESLDAYALRGDAKALAIVGSLGA